MDSPAGTKMSIYTLLALVLTGGSYTVIDFGTDSMVDYAIALGDHRWVNEIDHNKDVMFEIEYEIKLIDKLIKQGDATSDDLIRKGFLEGKLRYLKEYTGVEEDD